MAFNFCLPFFSCTVVKNGAFLKTERYNLISSRAKSGTKVPIYSCTENNIDAKKKKKKEKKCEKAFQQKISLAAKYKVVDKKTFCFLWNFFY